MQKLRIAGTVLSFALTVVSCNRDGEVIYTPSKGSYDRGVLVINEGNFNTPTAEVSFIDDDFSKIENGLYEKVNKQKLGDVLNGVAFRGDDIYMVVNNSNKVVVANRYTLEKTAEITEGVHQPRHATFSGKYLYVTGTDFFNAHKNGVSIYDETNKFVKKISFQEQCEFIASAGNNVFVQNASFGSGNKLTIISNETNEVISTLEVPQGNIQKTISHNDNVYVMASSNKDESSYIYQYNAGGILTKTITLKGILGAKNLVVDRDKFYFTAKTGVYTMGLEGKTTPQQPFFIAEEVKNTLYGFNVIDGFVYISDTNYTDPSNVYIYTSNGKLIKEFKANFNVNAFYKN